MCCYLTRMSISLVLLVSFVRCALQSNCIDMKVLSLNVLGLPERYGGLVKEERIDAIAREVAKGSFDIYFLQELWLEQDHDKIASSLKKGYYITGFRQFTPKSGRFLDRCDGIFSPVECSGLAIISKYPFKEIQFNSFSDRGDDTKALIDSEAVAAKGAGRVRIEPMQDLSIDLFTTHLIAEPEPQFSYSNKIFREKQSRQLMDEWVLRSNADIVILGGDFNTAPETDESSIYQRIRRDMKNAGEEMYSNKSQWLKEEFSTYANPSNTFKSGNWLNSGEKSSIVDYIFWRENNPSKTKVKISSFYLPAYKTLVPNLRQGPLTFRKYFIAGLEDCSNEELLPFYRDILKLSSLVSLSDHEAIASTLTICSLK